MSCVCESIHSISVNLPFFLQFPGKRTEALGFTTSRRRCQRQGQVGAPRSPSPGSPRSTRSTRKSLRIPVQSRFSGKTPIGSVRSSRPYGGRISMRAGRPKPLWQRAKQSNGAPLHGAAAYMHRRMHVPFDGTTSLRLPLRQSPSQPRLDGTDSSERGACSAGQVLALLPRGKGFDVRYAHPPSPSPARQYTVPAERKTPLHPTQARPAAAQPPRCTNFPCCQHWSRRPAQQVLSAHPPTHAPTRRSRVRCGGGQGEVWLSVAGRGKCGCGVREVWGRCG